MKRISILQMLLWKIIGWNSIFSKLGPEESKHYQTFQTALRYPLYDDLELRLEAQGLDHHTDTETDTGEQVVPTVDGVAAAPV